MGIIRVAKTLALGGDDLGLPEVKEHLRVTGDAEDGIIQRYITSSLAAVETYTGYWFAIWDVAVLFEAVTVLPRTETVPETARPVAPVLEYVDELGDPQTEDIAKITYDARNRIAVFDLPEVTIEAESEFSIVYGTRRPEAGSISDSVHQARLITTGMYHLDRDAGGGVPPGARELLDSFRRNQS